MKTIDPDTIKDFRQYEIRPKLNGIFAEWDGEYLRTKSGNIINSVPHIVPEYSACTKGELYSHGMPFQKINHIVMQGRDRKQEIQWYPHHELEAFKVENRKEFERVYRKVLKGGYEGVVLTNIHTGEMFKHKPRKDMEALVVGFNPGTGKNKDTFGSLRLITKDGQEFNCGNLTDADRRRLWVNRSIGATVTVSYSFLSERGAPVSPSFIDYRFDKTIGHGGKREGAGRKPKKKEDRRDIKRMYRFNDDEYEDIKRTADRLGMKEPDFIRYAIMSFVAGETG